MILDNIVHLFICGMRDAGKVLLLTRRYSSNDYHIEHILFLWDVIFLGTVNPKDIYLLFREDRYKTTDEENLGFKKNL